MNKETEKEILNISLERYGRDVNDKSISDKISAIWFIKYDSGYWILGNYTIAKIISTEEVEEVNMIGLGIAKRNPKDRYNEEVGKKIAFSRAAKDYINKIYAFHLFPEKVIT